MRLLEEHTPQVNKTIIMQPGSEVHLGTIDSVVARRWTSFLATLEELQLNSDP
jgi:hypothetical protein